MNPYLEGYKDAKAVVRLWFRLLPGMKSKLIALAIVPFIWAALWLSVRSGPTVLDIAQRGTGDQVGEYATNYVLALQDGDLGAVGISVVTAVALAGFISPFTSGGNVTLIPERDLQGVRPSRFHTYPISLVTTAVSIIGFFQLLSLTLISSLLSTDANPMSAVLLGWAAWIPLLAVTVAQMWATELFIRTVPRPTRLVVMASLVGSVTLALYLFERPRAWVGLAANSYAELVRHAATNGGIPATSAIALTAATAAAIGLGVFTCRRAQARPAYVPPTRSDTILRLRTVTNPYLMMTQIIAAQVLRNREIRRPIAVIFVVNIVGCWLVGTHQQQMSALLTIPVAVGAAWGANMFGLLGPGLPWLATQPNLLRALPSVAYPVQAALSVGLCLICWSTVAVHQALTETRTNFGADHFAGLFLGSLAVTAILTRGAFHHALQHPAIVRLGGRGDAAVRPGSAISYTLRYTPPALVVAYAITSAHHIATATAITMAVCCWCAGRWVLTHRRWDCTDRRAEVVRRVSA